MSPRSRGRKPKKSGKSKRTSKRPSPAAGRATAVDPGYSGLGIELKAADGALQIVKVITGSPAERGGIRSGDKITSVDGQPTAELSTDQSRAAR